MDRGRCGCFLAPSMEWQRLCPSNAKARRRPPPGILSDVVVFADGQRRRSWAASRHHRRANMDQLWISSDQFRSGLTSSDQQCPLKGSDGECGLGVAANRPPRHKSSFVKIRDRHGRTLHVSRSRNSTLDVPDMGALCMYVLSCRVVSCCVVSVYTEWSRFGGSRRLEV
jgi:hypothetical protein